MDRGKEEKNVNLVIRVITFRRTRTFEIALDARLDILSVSAAEEETQISARAYLA